MQKVKKAAIFNQNLCFQIQKHSKFSLDCLMEQKYQEDFENQTIEVFYRNFWVFLLKSSFFLIKK